MSDNKAYDLAIIGAGPVGLFAAFYARMREMQSVILDTLPEPGGQLTALYPEKLVYDVPGFPSIQARELAKNLVEQARSEFVDWQLGRKIDVLRQDDEGWHVGASDGKVYCARTVLITAGVGSFTPNTLGLGIEDRYEGKGLYYFARNFSEFDDRDVVIAGGGDSAVDWALSLADRAKSITLVHRRKEFRAHEANIEKLKRTGVRIVTPAQIVDIKGEDGVEAVVIEHKESGHREEIAAERLILALGFKADSGPIVDWGLAMEGNKIVVDVRGATNLPGVFAAGDIAYHPEIGNLKLMVVGFGQAAIAVSAAQVYMNPRKKMFAGHSSSMKSLQKETSGESNQS